MVPLGKALLEVGHEVAFATAESFRDAVERDGFTHHRAGLEWDESRIEETVPDILDVRRNARSFWILNNLFLDRSPRQMVPDLLAICEAERPDLFAVNNYEFGGVLAAERLGVPYVTCNISMRWPRSAILRVCGPRIQRLRRDLGFPRDPLCRAYGRYLDVCLMPTSWTVPQTVADPFWGDVIARQLRNQPLLSMKARIVRRAMAADFALQSRRHPVDRKAIYARPGDESPARPRPAVLDGLPDQPTVYVSLGTVFNSQYPEVFDAILAGLRAEPLNVVMTLGTDGDIARFGTLSENVRIERFVPQDELLPYVDLCVNHGGNGAVFGAFAHGVPQVILPLSADQPTIGLIAKAHGAASLAPASAHELMDGLVPWPIIDPARLTPDVIRDVVVAALASSELRDGASKLQATLRDLPSPADVVERLVALASA